MGFIYIAANSAMPGMVKVGITKGDPRERAAGLSTATGVPAPFVLTGFFSCMGKARAAESLFMQSLDEYRVSSNREFFRVSMEEGAIGLFLAAAEARGEDEGLMVWEIMEFHMIWRAAHQELGRTIEEERLLRLFTCFLPDPDDEEED